MLKLQSKKNTQFPFEICFVVRIVWENQPLQQRSLLVLIRGVWDADIVSSPTWRQQTNSCERSYSISRKWCDSVKSYCLVTCHSISVQVLYTHQHTPYTLRPVSTHSCSFTSFCIPLDTNTCNCHLYYGRIYMHTKVTPQLPPGEGWHSFSHLIVLVGENNFTLFILINLSGDLLPVVSCNEIQQWVIKLFEHAFVKVPRLLPLAIAVWEANIHAYTNGQVNPSPWS